MSQQPGMLSSILGGRPGRRSSLGGFVIIEDDEFTRAKRKLQKAAISALGSDDESSVTPKVSITPKVASQIDNKDNLNGLSYWDTVRVLSKSYDEKRAKQEALLKSRQSSVSVPALNEPSDPPPRESLAVPPPPEIMRPAGNQLVNKRIELALSGDVISIAQTVGPERIEALERDELYIRACEIAGFPPDQLRILPLSKFRYDTKGRPRSQKDLDNIYNNFEVDRIKKLTLVLTEYKRLVENRELQKRAVLKQGRSVYARQPSR